MFNIIEFTKSVIFKILMQEHPWQQWTLLESVNIVPTQSPLLTLHYNNASRAEVM